MESIVYNIEALEPEYRKAFDPAKPWIFEADGPSWDDTFTQEAFYTEEDACARQREWREDNGFHPITGARA